MRKASLIIFIEWTLVLMPVAGYGSPPTSGRLIATGWDAPSPAKFREGLPQFERWGVFDGTTIAPTRKQADGRTVNSRNAFGREHWDWSEFTEAVRDLRQAKPTTATNNFLFLYANPGNVDWFDDEGWQEVVDHWRLLARLAREGGLKGVLFDAEPYTPPHSQFKYLAQAQRDQRTFAEYRGKARQRGREVMKAVAAEFPDITIMTYRLFCDLLPALDTGNLTSAIETNTYGLLPAFVDGWFDEIPATVRIIEGDEDAYRFNSQAQFDRAFTRLKLSAGQFVSPQNRIKFRTQYDVGHGIYLDAHVNPPTSPWYIDRLGGTSAARLKANVSSALAASDEFVWIYGERGRWWPGASEKYPPWPERLPGADVALRHAKDPTGAARDALARAEPKDNRLQNGAFANLTDNGKPKEWWTWQDKDSRGRLSVDQGAACITGAANAVFGQNVAVKAGETYAVRCRIRSTERGFSCTTVAWKDSQGKWTQESMRRRFAPLSGSEADDWREALGEVQVPPGAAQLIFMLSVQGQLTESDRACFDDAQLVQTDD